MGAFVLGVLVGWLAEWLFYTYWVKAGVKDDDCSALKAELELKNRQISSLQTQLASASDSDGADTQSKPAANLKVSSQASDKSVTDSKSISQANSNAIASKSPTKTDAKSSSKSKSSKPASAKNEKAPTTKKTVTKTPSKSAAKSTKAGGDDFTKITGIGPSMSATLKNLGIDTFKKLADTDDDILRDMLEESGARMNNNKEAMDSWNEQATVAATGDYKALKAMQAELKK